MVDLNVRFATKAQLQRVHDKNYVARLESLDGDSCWLAEDTTAVSPGSVEAARLAAAPWRIPSDFTKKGDSALFCSGGNGKKGKA